MARPRPSSPLPAFRLQAEAGSLVTVGEALCSCDPEALCIALLRHQARWSVNPSLLGARRLRPLTSRVRAALRSMDALRRQAPAPARDQVVLPWETFGALGPPGAFERRLGAAQVPVASTSDAVRVLRACGGPAWGSPPAVARRLLDESAPSAPWTPWALDASLGSWGDEPWARVLARPLWVPRDQTADDSLQVAAALFWALTRRGFSPRAGTAPGLRPPPSASAARAASGPPRPASDAAPLVRLLRYNAWTGALRAQIESARLLEVC